MDALQDKSLGIDELLLGSTFYVLVHHVLSGTVEENLTEVWVDIESCYVTQDVAMRLLQELHRGFKCVSNVGRQDFQLSETACKKYKRDTPR